MLQVLALMMSAAISTPPAFDANQLLTAPTRHVRALTPELAEILAIGVRRSRTFAQMVARLEYSDVIVQIVPSSSMKASLAGRLLLVPGDKPIRFVRIEVRMEGTKEDLVTIVGHELRHAVELADAPHVRDPRSLADHYRRIGHGTLGAEEYDTDAAVRAGRQVRLEIQG
jgi:hypothetical protein